MSQIALILLITFGLAGVVYGMDCSFGQSGNIVSEFANTCPRPVFDSSDKTYCCFDLKKENFYCCDAEEFTLKTGFGIILPVIIGVAIFISLIVCCVSCLCCSCCPWYRRRHGTVYGKVHSPTVIHVIQTPGNPTENYACQSYVGQTQPPQNAYSTNATGMPAAPPQYTQEAYAKQAPYNPNYAH